MYDGHSELKSVTCSAPSVLYVTRVQNDTGFKNSSLSHFGGFIGLFMFFKIRTSNAGAICEKLPGKFVS